MDGGGRARYRGSLWMSRVRRVILPGRARPASRFRTRAKDVEDTSPRNIRRQGWFLVSERQKETRARRAVARQEPCALHQPTSGPVASSPALSLSRARVERAGARRNGGARKFVNLCAAPPRKPSRREKIVPPPPPPRRYRVEEQARNSRGLCMEKARWMTSRGLEALRPCPRTRSARRASLGWRVG